MITDIQIFTALMVALTAAILAIGLGRQLIYLRTLLNSLI